MKPADTGLSLCNLPSVVLQWLTLDESLTFFYQHCYANQESCLRMLSYLRLNSLKKSRQNKFWMQHRKPLPSTCLTKPSWELTPHLFQGMNTLEKQVAKICTALEIKYWCQLYGGGLYKQCSKNVWQPKLTTYTGSTPLPLSPQCLSETVFLLWKLCQNPLERNEQLLALQHAERKCWWT